MFPQGQAPTEKQALIRFCLDAAEHSYPVYARYFEAIADAIIGDHGELATYLTSQLVALTTGKDHLPIEEAAKSIRRSVEYRQSLSLKSCQGTPGVSLPPVNAAFAVVLFCSSIEEKEAKVGDLRENFEVDISLVGEERARILSYLFAARVVLPAFGEWVRKKIVKRMLGAVVEWLHRKVN